MNSKSVFLKLLFIFGLILNWTFPSMGDWGVGLSWNPNASTTSNLLIDTGPNGSRYTGGIDLIRQRVEELVKKLTVQHGELKKITLGLTHLAPISIYQTDSNCEQTQECNPKIKFIGALSPIKIKDDTFYITTRHSLVGFSNKKLIFKPQFDFNHFKVIQFKLANDSYYSDLLLMVPSSYFKTVEHCTSSVGDYNKLEEPCLNDIKTTILKCFTAPEANAYWLASQPIQSAQLDIEWKFAAGVVNPTPYTLNEPTSSPTLSHYFSLVNNISNRSQSGVSGNLIRKINFDTNSRQPSIGKFLGLITCKSKLNENHSGFTFALNIDSFFKDTLLEGFLTTIDQLSKEPIRDYNIFRQLECDPIDGRSVGGY